MDSNKILVMDSNKIYHLQQVGPPVDPEDAQKKSLSQVCLFGSIVFGMGLAYVWVEALEKGFTNSNTTVSIFGIFPLWIPEFVMCITILSLCSSFVVHMVSAGQRYRNYVYLLSFVLFSLQFLVYMCYAAYLYPHACDFEKYEHGTSFKGRQVVNASQGSPVQKRVFEVSCSDVKVFNTVRGSREIFQVMAHLFPLIILIMFKFSVSQYLRFPPNFATTLINLTDIQDLFALTMEDEIIKNYWGRDMCGESNVLGLLQYDCSGDFRILWFVIFTFLAISFLQVTVQISLQCLRSVSRQPLVDEKLRDILDGFDYSNNGLKSVDRQFQKILQSRPCAVYASAISSLICIDLPFILIRCWCSWLYGIVASSLLLKNVVCIFIHYILIYSQCRYGNVKAVIDQNPHFAMIVDIAEQYVGFERQDGAYSQIPESAHPIQDAAWPQPRSSSRNLCLKSTHLSRTM